MSTRLMATACALAVAAAAAPASAHPPDYRLHRIEIADSPPPPEPEPKLAAPRPPREPLVTSLGWRMGMTSLVVDDGERRTAAVLGLQGGVELSRRLRGYAEYQWLMMSGDTADDTRTAPHGMGHMLAGGLHLTLLDTTFKKRLRFYVDADGMAGLTVVSDSLLGNRLVPVAAGGVRFGYQALHEHPSPASSFDAHILVRVTRTEAGSGFMFGVGMEWGG